METNLNRCNEDCQGCGDCYVATCEIHDDGTPAVTTIAQTRYTGAPLAVCADCAGDDVGRIYCTSRKCGEVAQGQVVGLYLCAACMAPVNAWASALAVVNAGDAAPVAEVHDGDTTPLPAMSMAELVFGAGTVRP